MSTPTPHTTIAGHGDAAVRPRGVTRRRTAGNRGSRSDAASRFDLYQAVTDQIVGLLEAGTAPWKSGVLGTPIGRPVSLTTGRPYRGVNVFLLAMAGLAGGYDSAHWVTYKQAQARGGQVRKGEKGTLVVFWKVLNDREKLDRQAAENGNADRRFVLRYYRVWNARQCDGITPPDAGTFSVPATAATQELIPAAEAVLAGYRGGPAVLTQGTVPAYAPASDVVKMPEPALYRDRPSYYGDLFHELGHSTGHARRLDRWGKGGPSVSFRSDSYSREELVAEMTAAFLCGHCGISPATIDSSASYLAGWIERLRGDSRLVIAAAGAAQKAADHILGVPAYRPQDEDAGE